MEDEADEEEEEEQDVSSDMKEKRREASRGFCVSICTFVLVKQVKCVPTLSPCSTFTAVLVHFS